MSEREIQDAIRTAIPPELAVLWRNNVGTATHVDRTGKVWTVRYGLAPGSADLIGLRPTDGKFLALEVKQPGKQPTEDQRRWLALVNRLGGVARVVCSVDEAVEAVTFR